MAEHRVIVFPPGEGGGRRIQVGSQTLGTAYSLHDLSVFLERAGAWRGQNLLSGKCP
ncbi:hypothetical protein [Streptomyces sp. NPDC002573]|uniref:hypothetical protein n=1 Tax=Streptomyces sp. NPDC002573 TaxID=3364651 RepID=UPI0036C478F3